MAYADLDGIHVPTAGNRPPASWGAQVNANFDHYYDNFGAKAGQWTSFTPTLTQSATPTKTVVYARYIKLGRLVIAQVYLNVTSSGTGANNVIVGLPVTAAQASLPAGSLYIYDASVGVNYIATATLASTTTIFGVRGDGSAGVLGSSGFTAALANGDSVLYNVQYESAT